MILSRREFAASGLALLAKKPAPKRPGIVLLVANELPTRALGCYGNKDARTPQIDLLAREGTRLKHYACAPARAEGLRTLLTGRTPRQRDGAALPDILGPRGYACGKGMEFIDRQSAEKPFFALIDFAGDDQIPALTASLAKRGIRDNTVIIFTATGGKPDAGLREDAVATPMIWSWLLRVPPGSAQPELVSAYDLVPSLCEAAGVEAPEGLCGRSYLHVAENKPMPKKHPWRSLVFADSGNDRMARDSRYKLIVGPNEFYDEVADPQENVNQYDNPGLSAMRDGLASELADWLKQHGG
jgi:arylsulfatase A-like enzyme